MHRSCLASFIGPPNRSCARPLLGRQHGQGAVEFLLAAVPVLLIGLGSIEAIHWYFARQAVSLALAQAARAAITQHAHPQVLDQAFMQALLPLHAGPTPAASQARLRNAMARREHATGLPAWRIRIVSPSAATFSDFASHDPDLPLHGQPVIDNDYLHERHQARLSQGWQHGRGPLSGQTTLEANTLVLHLTWLHAPLLPGVSQLVKQLAPPDTRYGSQAMARAGYLPMNRQLSFVMQSHPIAWQMPAHGRVVRLASPRQESRWQGAAPAHEPAAPAGQPPSYEEPPAPTADAGGAGPAITPRPGGNDSPHACTGLWCLDFVFGGTPQGDGDAAPASPGEAEDPTGPNAGPDVETENGGSYLDAGTDADWPPESAEPDDCPGCCA